MDEDQGTGNVRLEQGKTKFRTKRKATVATISPTRRATPSIRRHAASSKQVLQTALERLRKEKQALVDETLGVIEENVNYKKAIAAILKSNESFKHTIEYVIEKIANESNGSVNSKEMLKKEASDIFNERVKKIEAVLNEKSSKEVLKKVKTKYNI